MSTRANAKRTPSGVLFALEAPHANAERLRGQIISNLLQRAENDRKIMAALTKKFLFRDFGANIDKLRIK